MHIKPIKLKKLLQYVFLTLAIGMGGGLLAGNTEEVYANLTKPPLSPPGILFPIVWSILYVLMGIGAYFLSEEKGSSVKSALAVYWVQLFANALWPIVFWKLQEFTLAAVLIGFIAIMVAILIIRSVKISKISAWLFLPYLLWLIFALYLNIGFTVLN